MAGRIDAVDGIVLGIGIAVLRKRICQNAREGILRDEAAVLGRVIPCPQILQARERVLLLAVVPKERRMDAVLIGVDIAIRIVGVALRYRTPLE